MVILMRFWTTENMFKFSSHLDNSFYHLQKKMATHSNTLAWKILWTEEPGRLQSLGLQRVGHDWVTSLSLSHDSLSESEGRSVLSDSLWPHGLYSPWKSPGQEYWSGYPFPSPGNLPNPEVEPRSPPLLADSLPAEPQGKPKNTGVSSVSLLQWIFPTQESNQGLLLCRRVLYKLSC